MAFNDYETSRDKGQPVDLYEFTYGQTVEMVEGVEVFTNLSYTYTDGETPVEFEGKIYSPLAISRSNFQSTGNLDSGELTIKLPRVSEIVELFRVYQPAQIVSVKIRQGHIANPNDPELFAEGNNFPVAWLGRVMEPSIDGNEASLTCEAATVSMDRPGLRRHYQWACPLVLYGPRCIADKISATIFPTVSEIEANRIRLSAPWIPSGLSASKYVGGMLQWTGANGPEFLSILRADPDDWLILSNRVRSLEVGDTIGVSLGCNHTIVDCQFLHNNIVNYGGQPFIPVFNPVFKNNHT